MIPSEWTPEWSRRAAALLDAVIAHGDDMGHLANSTADDLRDALKLAGDRLRVAQGREPRGAWATGSRRLVAEVWDLVDRGVINSRSPAADAALDLRDTIDSTWNPPD